MLAYQTNNGVFGPGGHGGGIFQTTISGLGSTSVGPQGVYSEKTLNLQIEANAVLPQIGKSKIAEDGKLGPETCRAIKNIVSSGKYSGWSVPNSCSTAIAKPADVSLDKPGMSNSTKLLLAAGGVVLLVGGYIAWKRF